MTVRHTDRQTEQRNSNKNRSGSGKWSNSNCCRLPPIGQRKGRRGRYRCICTIVPLRSMAEKVDLHCRFKEKDCVQLLELPSPSPPPALFANSISDLFMGRFSELSATVECPLPLPIPHMTNYMRGRRKCRPNFQLVTHCVYAIYNRAQCRHIWGSLCKEEVREEEGERCTRQHRAQSTRSCHFS